MFLLIATFSSAAEAVLLCGYSRQTELVIRNTQLHSR